VSKILDNREYMPDSITDSELIKSFVEGNESAFNRFVLRYQDKIYWHARRLVGNHLDADEIVQEVLVVLYRKLKTFEFKSSVYTWIYTITYTRSLNYLKKKKIKNFLSLSEINNYEDELNNVVDDLEKRQKLEQIEKALLRLPIKQREVFVMRNYEEMTYDEISQITGKSVGALKSNYFHAINKLKELVKDDK
jgi:RNA polymerase sigma-70 factor (ECF subfamily)